MKEFFEELAVAFFHWCPQPQLFCEVVVPWMTSLPF